MNHLDLREEAQPRPAFSECPAEIEGLPLEELSPSMRQVYQVAARAARARISVLVVGPTGAGKELVARTLHRLSGRADKPLVAIHCAAPTAPLPEAEPFG